MKNILKLSLCVFIGFQCERGWLRKIADPNYNGCMDKTACNYNDKSFEDDGSCYYLECTEFLDNTDCICKCGNNGEVGETFDTCGTCGGDGPVHNFDCDGNCITEIDCAGECGGSAVVDECGTCGGSGPPQNYDCDGNCIVEKDCADVCGGGSSEDNCGVCDNDITNDCVQDCFGEWGGDIICGCKDETACNFDDTVTFDNGSCSYPEEYYDCDGNCIKDSDGDGLCDTWETVTDIDGNIYITVQIGTQLWMAENLKTTKYKDNTAISTGHSNSDWANLSTGAYAVYDNNSSNADTYGNLYNWYAIETQQLCMDGWHVPSDDEFKILELYLGMCEGSVGSIDSWVSEGCLDNMGYRGFNEGSKLAGGKDLWQDGELQYNEEFGLSGFNALPGGSLGTGDNYEVYDGMGVKGFYWTNTVHSAIYSRYRILWYYLSQIRREYNRRILGLSVRCLKD